jgi:glycosyltransferase involved in cell wall biosynthesis
MSAMSVTHVMAFSEEPGQPVFSGAEKHLFELMQGQFAAGISVRLVMIIVHDGPQLQSQARTLESTGMPVRVVHHHLALRKRIGPAARLAVLPALVRVLRERPDDIVNTHLPQASQLGRLAASVARCTRVVDSVHSDDPAFRRPAWRLRYALLDRGTGAYIAISEAVRRLLVDAVGVPAKKVHVVHYGVAAPGPEPDRREARRRLGLDQNAFVVGFVGRLTPAKDLPALLCALGVIPDAVGLLIGGGEDETALRESATAQRVDNVNFLGPLDDAASLMRAFDVFCLPSRWEGLGLVLLEAMWRDVPIVASRAGAIPEVLDNGDCGLLFAPGDVDGLVAAIRDVRGDPAAAAARVLRARRRVETIFTVDQMVTGVSAVYSMV